MKRITFLIICLCHAFCVVQATTDSIPKSIQRQCAEYVAIKYTDRFIKSLKGSPSDADYQRYNTIFSDVSEWEINDTIKFQDYFDWMSDPNNKFGLTNNQLTTIVRKRETIIIDSLLCLSTDSYANKVEDIIDELRNNIIERINEIEKPQKANKKEFNGDSPRLSETKIENTNNHNTMSPLLVFVIGITIALLLISMVFYLLLRKRIRDYIISTIIDSKRINSKFVSSDETNNSSVKDNSSLLSKIDSLKKENEDLRKAVKELTMIVADLKKNFCQTKTIEKPKGLEEVSSQQGNSSHEWKYAENYSDGRLKECSEKYAQYKIFSSNNGTYQFECCVQIETARANPDAVFDSVCSTSGSIANASKIITENRGEAKPDGNYWIVTRKATIKFI